MLKSNLVIQFFIISQLLLVTLTAQAKAQIETVFNTPGFYGQRTTTLEDKLIEMIKSSVTGSKIRIALYTLDRTVVAQELVHASQRGVDVQIVLDGGNAIRSQQVGHAINVLVEGFNGNSGLICANGESDCIKFCSGPLAPILKPFKIKKNFIVGESCRGLISNHNKLFLFTELNDGSKNIVAQTSANMTAGQLKMYNDLIIIKNDEIFFNHLYNYWQKLKKDNTQLFKKSFPTISEDEKYLTAYFFPRPTARDPIKALLRRVNCHLPDSIIRVSHSSFSRHKVAYELKRLKEAGCKVEVIARIDPKQHSPSKKVKKALAESIVLLPYDGQHPDQQSENSIHTKIVTINAAIDNSPEKIKVVLTGSYNLDIISLRANDETLIEVRDDEIYEHYNQFLDQILFDARSANISINPIDPN